MDAIDLSGLRAQLGDDAKVLREIAQAFGSESRASLDRLPALIETGNWLEVRRLAHTTKSAMRTFRAREAQEHAQRLETLAQMDEPAGAAELFERLRVSAEPVVVALLRYATTGLLD